MFIIFAYKITLRFADCDKRFYSFEIALGARKNRLRMFFLNRQTPHKKTPILKSGFFQIAQTITWLSNNPGHCRLLFSDEPDQTGRSL